jgi:hypothetical protein
MSRRWRYQSLLLFIGLSHEHMNLFASQEILVLHICYYLEPVRAVWCLNFFAPFAQLKAQRQVQMPVYQLMLN